MVPSKKSIALKGSERHLLAESVASGPAAPDERIMVTLLLRRRVGSTFPAVMASLSNRSAPGQATTPSHQSPAQQRQAFAADHGADPEDIARVTDFAKGHGIGIADVKPAERRVVLTGTVASMSQAFAVSLSRFTSPHGDYRGRTGALHVPADLADIIEGVFGLDDRPQASPHFRIAQPGPGVLQAHVAGTSYTPVEIASIYHFPDTASRAGVSAGAGQCIAIIELGGGYTNADLQAYFKDLGRPTPDVITVSVDGAGNSPTGDANSADSEVMLDIEVAAAVAPGAQIAVYFAPNTDAGFLNAISTAVHDSNRNPSVVSISWGGPESNWTRQAMHAMDSVFQDAASLGVTICCASGDDGSSDLRPPAPDDGQLHVDFPASSPFALACGGTRLRRNGTHFDEDVWNELARGGATGGGVSTVFPVPAWQSRAHVPISGNPQGGRGRGVPDVAGNADPQTGYRIRVDGKQFVIGGTSAVAPLYAGLVALLNAQLGHAVGFLNPVLYALPKTSIFKDITKGNNDITGKSGHYPAGKGWDACTGLGRIDGSELLAQLQSH